MGCFGFEEGRKLKLKNVVSQNAKKYICGMIEKEIALKGGSLKSIHEKSELAWIINSMGYISLCSW